MRRALLVATLVVGLAPAAAWAITDSSKADSLPPVQLVPSSAVPALNLPLALAAAADDTYTVQATASGLNRDGWAASVTYSAPQPNQPTLFTIAASGGPAPTGSYQYVRGFIYKRNPSSGVYDIVYDPSFGTQADEYQDSNTFSYQFASAGTYRVGFSVRNTVNNYYQSFTVDIGVVGSGFPDVNALVKDIVNECIPNKSASDYEKALALHDWVLENVSYDHSFKNLGMDQALLGIPVTCEGYQAAYGRLLTEAGIEWGRVTGDQHVWTAVKLDGKWCQVDTTHDDVGDNISDSASNSDFPTRIQQMHMLFGVNNEISGKLYKTYSVSAPGYTTDSLENNYFIKTGDVKKWSDPVAQIVADKLKGGAVSFTVAAPNAGWPQDTYKNVINSLVAYDLGVRFWDNALVPKGKVIQATYANGIYSIVLANAVGAGAGNQSSSSSGSSTPSSSSAAKPLTKPAGAWIASGSRWWYRHNDGSYTRNGWELIDGVWYHFDGAGWMQTGWLKDKGSWYFLQLSGARTEGWQKVKGAWYYLRPGSGAMAVGWIKVGGKWYLLNGAGAMLTGWQKTGGVWYYLHGSGAMLTGWQKLGGKWYYFSASGAMATGWLKVDGAWYYLNGSGVMQANKWIGNYYVLSSGAMATNQWVGRYYVGADGCWVPGYRENTAS